MFDQYFFQVKRVNLSIRIDHRICKPKLVYLVEWSSSLSSLHLCQSRMKQGDDWTEEEVHDHTHPPCI